MGEIIELKSPAEIEVMQEGGAILSEVMGILLSNVDIGVEMLELDRLAESEIKKRGGAPSFKLVQDYKWTICACVNDIVVHGIPTGYKAQLNDVIGLDLGVYFKGFHTDSSWSVRVGKKKGKKEEEIDKFLKTGRVALDKAINEVKVGNYIYDVSKAIESTVTSRGYSIVKGLIGHGVGRQLHEAPEVPGFVRGKRENSVKIENGLTIAVEIIYNLGNPDVVYNKGDGWTIATKDGKLSGLFETTVAATNHGVILLSEKYGPPGDN